MPPQRVGFCVVLVLEKTEIDFVHFDLELGMVFKELTGAYEEYEREICEFEMDFTELFLLLFY